VRYKQFWPGDKVMTIVDYNGIPSGTAGEIASRWAGTAYVVRLPDGKFEWLDSRELGHLEPSNLYPLKEGDIGVVTSDKRQSFAKVGDKLEVVKVAYDVDYYGFLINNELRWVGGFQLALYN